MRITFLGAAGEVTGSQHLIETDNQRILLDCGLFQGRRDESRQKNLQFHCSPRNLDTVVLSHAHIDHSGRLPALRKHGYNGPVFATPATCDITWMMLRDSAKIQKEDAKYLAKKHGGHHPLAEPLYDEEDVRAIAKQFEPVPYGQWETVNAELKIRFLQAGHILGSAITELDILDNGTWKRIVYTGDLGRRDKPLLHDPETIERCDALICESTYGNRVHPEPDDVKKKLQEILCEAARKRGRVIIPAFSLGRTQLLIYMLNDLRNSNEICRVPVFVDSPLATRLTDIYRDYQEGMDEDVQAVLEHDTDIFSFHGLTYVQSQQESIALNRREGTFCVISASGMCENGRIVHHLKNGLPHEENTVLILGYQAQNTLGRKLVERHEYVNIHGRRIKVKANVVTLNGLSAHMGANDFHWWFGELAKNGGAGHVFLVHGEEQGREALAGIAADASDTRPVLPMMQESFEV